MISSVRQLSRPVLLAVLAAAVLLGPLAAHAQRPAPSVPVATPESAGMSSARLARLAAVFGKEIEDKKLPGAVMMVARKGKVVYVNALGVRDPKTGDPMRTDTIFRIYSMTKPIVSVAAMILVEDGKLQLTDPVAKWLPAFKDVKVWTDGGEVAAQRPMTVQDLLRHTAGLPYGELTQNAAVKDALAKAGLFKPGVIEFDVRDMTGAEQVERLAKIPLLYQPGTTWEYSLASDVLGRVVEAASGKRLGVFMAERVFVPLRMTDTAFWVPDGKRGRVAEPFDKDPLTGTAIRLIDVSKEPANDSGGAGGVGDRGRLPPLLADAGQRRRARRSARAEPDHRPAHDLGSSGIAHCARADARWRCAGCLDLHLRPRLRRAAVGRHRPGAGHRPVISTGAATRERASGSIPKSSSSASSWCSRRARCAPTIASSSGSSSTRPSSTER